MKKAIKEEIKKQRALINKRSKALTIGQQMLKDINGINPPVSKKKAPVERALKENLDTDGKTRKVDYDKHWRGMPEFNQPGLKPIKSLVVNLETKEDMHKFAKLVGQPITAKTKFIWYPFKEDVLYIDKRWSEKSAPSPSSKSSTKKKK